MQPSRKSITDLVLHLHPRTIPSRTLRFTLSWGLGGMAVMLVGLLFVTGILLLTVYAPSIGQAYDSVLFLSRSTTFGPWVRNIHHASANLLVVVAMLHLLRVALTGAFGPSRRLNWIVGLCLLFLVLAANFTGYLLPWDQLAYWAVTISTSMLAYIPLAGDGLRQFFLGGDEIGPATLANFHVLHVAVIPGSLLVLLGWHFWLVRRAGGLARQDSEGAGEERVPVMPDLLMREAAVGLGLAAFVLLLAMVWDAPLLEQANPGMSPNPTKAPWYFQGFQELLLHLHPMYAVLVWPLLGVAALVLVPFWKDSALPGGVWFGSRNGWRLAVLGLLAGALPTMAAILLDELAQTPGATSAGDIMPTRGLLPTLALAAYPAGMYLLLTRMFRRSRAEGVMFCLLMLFAAMLICTMVGVWSRGAEMRLVCPW
ncbi:cytochrome b N-terminal domain-containing protein [Pseudodesulfovibrio sp.]|uniref:cytochrome b N-terminal domain-containing protein n=1 Tax=Pseudodesulfovibrio sp. TaxID=2035812 RepID=UPI002626ABC0|nr:cytochrome b N-terminal domain-containing protein [Pseudodesulfovibrio sp.]MDD3311375.1 cytochrome b N-terminal domain-containing protein [Pseudodesulfovibrio sp.]